MTHANRDATERAVACWNRDDLDGYLKLYGDDVVLHGYAGLGPGLANVRRYYESWLQSFPGSRLTLEDVIAADDKVVCRFLISGTHRGSFQGVPASDRPIRVSGLTILRFADGVCVERWSQVDSIGLLSQIGALRLSSRGVPAVAPDTRRDHPDGPDGAEADS